MKFNAHMTPINDTKFMLFMGESWNLKSFISLLSDDFKWAYISPSSVLLLEAYTNGTLSATFNDNKIKFKGSFCNDGNGNTSCTIGQFYSLLKASQAVLDREMRFVCGADYSQVNDPNFQVIDMNLTTYITLNPMEALIQILKKPKEDVIILF